MADGEAVREEKETGAAIDGGTYDIIRKRLQGHGRELRSRLDRLNQSRRDIFGAIEQKLIATDRVTTPNNCIPRDMVPIPPNSGFIFGYNVFVGLRSETHLSDVFAIYDHEEHTFRERSPDILRTGRFPEVFKELYRYYKETRFAKFSVIGPHLYMVFRVGKRTSDIKVFKWAIEKDGIVYVDNRSEHEFRYPPQHDFQWTRTTRDDHRTGRHPHIAIADRVFVEAVGGDITFKVEDNTETGQGIYTEPVENPDQTLDDAEIHYAVMGHLVLARIKPYQEEQTRYFIFNGKTETVVRVDEIADACVRLPDDQGLIFSGGYYLQTGELKRFETGRDGMMFESRIASPNGEDFLYVFYHPESGDYLLLPYNIIEQAVATPLPCNGFSQFDNGEMILFRAAGEPARHHVIQVWQTPYVSSDYAVSDQSDAYLFKVGNPDIVRCMAECTELLRLIDREEPYAALYVDMVKKAGDIADAYFWVGHEEAFDLKSVLLEIKAAASSAVEAFEKVVRMKKAAAESTAEISGRVDDLLEKLQPTFLDAVDDFVKGLAALRQVRGEIISLKERRYADLEAVERLDARAAGRIDLLSARCVDFLLEPDALAPYREQVEAVAGKAESFTRTAEAEELEKDITAASGELEMLIEIVGNLKIDDPTRTTQIIDAISIIYSRLNQVKAGLRNRKKQIRKAEGEAEFNAQMKLLNQSVVNYLDICDTPERCDEYLTRVMITVEELEGRFADFDEFVVQLSEKRDEVYTAFESKKLNLVEARNRRAGALTRLADRILSGIQTRAGALDDLNAVNGYFASDLMVGKVRDIVTQLQELGDTVKADDIQSRLRTIREDTVRQLKDRQDLYADGVNLIQFGRHRFSVNTQNLDLTVVQRDGQALFHLTGTDFSAPITDPAFAETSPVWDMTTVAENGEVYRGEYLAWQMLKELADPARAAIWREYTDEDRLAAVREFMGPRYEEGYIKGIHDQDGAKLISSLFRIRDEAGLLRHPPQARAMARLFWAVYFQAWADETNRQLLADRLSAFGLMTHVFPGQRTQESYLKELETRLADFAEKSGLFPETLAPVAAGYLFAELTGGETENRQEEATGDRFVVSRTAREIAEGFRNHLLGEGVADRLDRARERLRSVPAAEFELLRDWINGYIAGETEHWGTDAVDYADEAAVLLFTGDDRRTDGESVQVTARIEGMLGDHPVIRNGVYELNYHHFTAKLERYEQEVVPLFRRYGDMKKKLTARMREELRLEEFRPRVFSAFVRNRLINQVYLPLIGDNLAKQIGTAGEEKRADRMGLLLLISPPGYGKTTLMEYLANRLGIIFMKINGPSLGHAVTSLDPAQAPNAGAREEIEKLNLSLEMGDNVMIYLDDIQHCNPEFLQKFISLCDAQRRIEGVYKGKSRTYDFRGKKVAVVMAGNPYTESGEKFRIPDMLANRADTYNLGDIIGDTYDAFVLSYLENALTSNPVLERLAGQSQKDIYGIIRIAETGEREGVELEGSYGAEELNEMVSTMAKLITLRDVILRVNQAYIASAAQADEYRTEPPFRLQGSYRNMNRMAEKVVPVMNEEELRTLILSHYEQEAQTLATGAEANLLKFKELTGWMKETEAARWEEIKKTFRKNLLFRGMDGRDPLSQVVAQLSAFYDGLSAIRDTLEDGGRSRIELSEETMSRLSELAERFAGNGKPETPAVPSKVEVVSRIPGSFLKVLKAQFEMMNAWMKPTFESGQAQSHELARLAEGMENMRAVYQELLRSRGDGDWKNIEQYTMALKANPKDHKTYYKRGLAWYNRDEVRRALSDFQNALDLEPKNKKYQRIVAHLGAELMNQ